MASFRFHADIHFAVKEIELHEIDLKLNKSQFGCGDTYVSIHISLARLPVEAKKVFYCNVIFRFYFGNYLLLFSVEFLESCLVVVDADC